MGLLGILSILALAYGLSRNRRAIKPSLVLWGLGLQILLAVLVLKTPFGGAFQTIGNAVNHMMKLAEDGSIFIFGDLGKSDGPLGIVLAFQILPLIVFVSSLFATLYYLGVMQWVVRGIAVVPCDPPRARLTPKGTVNEIWILSQCVYEILASRSHSAHCVFGI